MRFVFFLFLSINLQAWQNQSRAIVPLAKPNRVALVIGNGAYTESPLKNTIPDARAIRDTLSQMGFDVLYRENADLKAMDELVDDFKQKLTKGSVGLFYFSGHGVQTLKGENYLIPVGVSLSDEVDFKYRCFPAGQLLEKMDLSAAKTKIIILDACRNNPFNSRRDGRRGLASMNAPRGSIISFATRANEVAADGGILGNGLYTYYLLREIVKPGVSIEKMFKNVAIAVDRKSKGTQIPAYYSLLLDDFYFIPSTKSSDKSSSNPSDKVPKDTFELALDLYSGTSGKVNEPRARALMRKASQTNPVAKMWLAYFYVESECGLEKDVAMAGKLGNEAFSGVKELADQGNIRAKTALGLAYSWALGVARNFEMAFQLFGVTANQGDAHGAYWYAGCFEYGYGTEKDIDTAFVWYEEAANLGFVRAEITLGLAYSRGQGKTQSDEKARFWFEKAAKKGYKWGLFNLGTDYRYGRGGPSSDEEALRLFRAAADLGLVEAFNNIGWMYSMGRGVPQSDEKALEWFRKGALRGNAAAQYNLANKYTDSGIKAPAGETAIQWYQKAARQGFVEAQKELKKLGETW